MKDIKFDYGQTGLIVRVPNATLNLQTRQPNPLKNEHESILTALRNPIDSPEISDLVKPGSKVVITHTDITRATPNSRLLPAILQEIEECGVQRKDITLLNALGTHRQQTPQELCDLLGEKVYKAYHCEQHNAYLDSNLISVGQTSFGNNIRLNKMLLEADLKILTGFIEPHFFAGFSGGPKAVLPALAGAESVFTNHGYAMISNSNATFGMTDGNPIWEEMKEAALMVRNSFLVNVTLDRQHRITGVFAGDVISAHEKGCRFLRESSYVNIAKPFDIVITSNSGYPLDQNLYQCVKGLASAKRAVRKGGAILMLAECRDGLPDHGSYSSLLKKVKTPEDILKIVAQPSFKEQDAWQVQIQAYVQEHAKVYLYSDGLDDHQIEGALMEPVWDIEKTIKELISKYGDRVCTMPEGPMVIVNEKRNE